jgi:hypothetical protein
MNKDPDMENRWNEEHANNQQQSEQPPILLSDDQLQLFFDFCRDLAEITYRQEQMMARIDELHNQLIGPQHTSLYHCGQTQTSTRVATMLLKLEDF